MSKKQLINELICFSNTEESKHVLKCMSYKELEELHKNIIDPETLELIS